MSWQDDKRWSDKYLPAITEVLRQNAMHLLTVKVATDDDDRKRATDLVVQVEGGQVAVRLRRPGYRKKYRDLTIRAHRDSGAETELSKIKKGFARWYLYGWLDDHDALEDWLLVDLNRVRESGLLDFQHMISNGDGTYFVAISDLELRTRGCLIAEAKYEGPRDIPTPLKPLAPRTLTQCAAPTTRQLSLFGDNR